MYAAATDEKSHDTSVSLVASDTDDHLSGYKSDDHCEAENLSDEEFCSAPMKGALSKDACVVHGGSDGKIKLENGMIFTDIVAFRDVLWEYVIQEGFRIMRLRNDRVLKIPAEQWSRHAFDSRMKNDHVTNNISESFNHWVSDLRGKPILTLVDGLRSKLMSRLQKTKQKGVSWKGVIVPNVVKLLNTVREESRKCSLLMDGEGKYEVNDANIHYIVNLRKRTCDCKFWEIAGIPCRHADLGIAHRREELETYTDVRFSKQKYMRAYGHCINPIPDPSFWPKEMDVTPTDLKPPVIKRMSGRLKKSRKKNQERQQELLDEPMC
ncbi:hypothetical protein Salat_1933800 [Sesamum alatum]|uniref:SWIM-type domain-containing protein n=1 Tax=Sesamum alatum TaxID=300844 RepID=A0AAE1Y4N8_9LAMI|nr:hypothetical protein Salat_1933800 [Sesamum alatum]